MLFTLTPELSKRSPSDVLVITFWEKEKKPKSGAPLDKGLEGQIKAPIDAKDFTGKAGETVLLYGDFAKEKRVLLLGLGKEEDISTEGLRKTFATLTHFSRKKKYKNISILLPNVSALLGLSLEEFLEGVCEGVLLTNYRFEEKTLDTSHLLQGVTLIGLAAKAEGIVKHIETTMEGVYFARDLTNGNADIVTPAYLADTAKKLGQRFPALHVTVFDKKRIEQEKMGLLLAVGRGSPNDPAFIMLKYRGAPRSKDHTVLVGKGITYDTGGLNIKPTGSMETMRDDMAGAATVLGTLANVAALGLKVNVTGVIATCENAVDGLSYKPGDVYRSYSGKTVEIANTDAEGRLTLADALSYSVKNLSPTRLINLATLTGSVVIALGDEIAGLMSNNEELASDLSASSEATCEHIWRLPLHEAYREQIKSDIADLKNSGGRPAGSITAGLFLQEFVEKTPWAHLDIAGTAFLPKEKGYLPKNGVGFGVRLLTHFLKAKI